MNLTKHFTLEEMTASSTAKRLGLDNTPPEELIPRLIRTAEMLERIRELLGVPIIVTSGYRGRAVNEAVGGVSTSDHTQGHAADIRAPAYGSPLEVCRALVPNLASLEIGQLIYEKPKGSKPWTHVSTHVPDKPVNRVLTFDGKTYQLGIQDV